MLFKIGESTGSYFDFLEPAQALESPEVSARFNVFVDKLKKASDDTPVAPFKSEDFLYFRTVMMHAAERANVDKDGNETGDGRFVVSEKDGKQLWKWESAKGIHPYMNSNGDIFPESELLKAASTWVGKGLYCNHQSSDVEKLRGIIIDTIYDNKTKELWGLVALDKRNFPTLAAQVKDGTIRNVSMGTAVKRSVCTLCGNVAHVEADYCSCIRKGLKGKIVQGTLVGEINLDLNGIELSLVSVPADSKANIRHIYASMIERIESLQHDMSEPSVACDVKKLALMQVELDALKESVTTMKMSNFKNVAETQDNVNGGSEMDKTLKEERAAKRREIFRSAYYQGTVEPKPGQTMYPPEPMNESLRNEELAKAKKEENETAPKMGDKGTDQKLRHELQRTIAERKKEREKLVQAYFQGGGGVNEPKPGGQYSPDPTEQNLRKQDQSKFESEAKGTESDIHQTPQIKDKLQRASYLGARFVAAQNESGEVIPEKSYWAVYAASSPEDEFSDDSLLFTVNASEAYGNDLHKVAQDAEGNPDEQGRSYWQFMASKEYGRNLIDFVKQAGVEEVINQYKKAAEMNVSDAPLAAGLDGAPTTKPEEGQPTMGESAEILPEEKVPDAEKEKDTVTVTMPKEVKEGLEEALQGAVEEPIETPEEASLIDKGVETAENAPPMPEPGMPATAEVEAWVKVARDITAALKDLKKKKEDKKKDKKEEKKDKKEEKGDKKEKKEDKKDKCDEKCDEKEEKGGAKKGTCSECGKPNFLCKCNGKKKDANATGREVYDIPAPSNKGNSVNNATGREVYDIPDLISPLVTDSVDSDNVGGQDMRVESKEEQHEKDMAAATTAPTGNVDKVAQSIARTITAESVDEAKRLAVAKMKRSYDLATSMKAKGLISEAQIKAKADEFFSLSDDAFESVIRVVEGLAAVETVKTASAVASLGQVNGSTTLPASSSGDAPNNLKDRLDTLWNTPSKGVKFF